MNLLGCYEPAAGVYGRRKEINNISLMWWCCIWLEDWYMEVSWPPAAWEEAYSAFRWFVLLLFLSHFFWIINSFCEQVEWVSTGGPRNDSNKYHYWSNWLNLEEFGRIWKNLEEFGRIWKGPRSTIDGPRRWAAACRYLSRRGRTAR